MNPPAADPAFERALAAEIIESEQIRVRVLTAVLGVVLVLDELLFTFGRDLLRQFLRVPVPVWQPLSVIGPFLAYEIVVLFALRNRISRGKDLPTLARFANVLIETSLFFNTIDPNRTFDAGFYRICTRAPQNKKMKCHIGVLHRDAPTLTR
jgi:adenylate cyclase